ARLIGARLPSNTAREVGALDAEADRLGQLTASRVTLVADDGRVVGDSTQSIEALATLENHATRPEIVAAGSSTIGTSRRHSTTINTDMLYVATRTSHPVVRYVRVSLPLSGIDAQIAVIRTIALAAAAASVPLALLVSWFFSAPLARRVQAIAGVAERYSSGDLSRSTYDYGEDELGLVARVMDDSVHELGRRLDELSRDRARMEAILSGMVEGVLVVDAQGRLQLVNQAAQAM